jgi:hypothetical protein
MTQAHQVKVPRILDFTEWYKKSLVARSSKIMYTPTPKVACTTIKAAIVLLEEPSRIDAPRPHDPSTHGVPTLLKVSPDESKFVLNSPDWVRFCVTRRPYERLVSAWVDKVFAGRSLRTLPYAEAVLHTRDIGGQFREFVKALNEDHPLYRGDQHFVTQVRLLHPEVVPYTHILDVSELESFAAWVRSSHPSRLGFDVSARRNQSLKVPLRAMFDRATASVVEDLYRADFEAFHYEREEFDEEAEEFLLTENELVLVERVSSMEAEVLLNRAKAKVADQRRGGRYGLQELLRTARGRSGGIG